MLLTPKQASQWASKHLNKNVTPANITYLIQYGRIESVVDKGSTLIPVQSLENYYSLNHRKTRWKDELGDDLNWTLSFEKIKEAETTKHVHRLHPYKGKFIPQLVGYFLDAHTDNFKRDIYFRPGDIVLDPFCGSGTTLVQANELGMHAIGLDVSAFNAFISNAKVTTYNLTRLYEESQKITVSLKNFVATSKIVEFESKLAEMLVDFNNQYFPVSFKRQIRAGEIDQKEYGTQKEAEFLNIYHGLVSEYQIDIQMPIDSARFMKQWYLPSVRAEIDFVHSLIRKVKDPSIQNALMLILSRTIRSCRATTHADLGTLRKPMTTTYYCRKHGKICKPLFSILSWWERYCKDSVQRWVEFGKLKTDTRQHCLTGDSRTIDIFRMLKQVDPQSAEIAQKQRIKGIFTSPPYVGLINYHEQHAYAYDLFGFKRLDELEIGPLFRGKGREARESYIHGVAAVFKNCKRFLTDAYDVFIVANDKFNMYPTIAEIAGMHIVNQHKRPVLNRTEKNRESAYSETIFHLKERRS
ncbi:restriction endonuclease subunit M [Candidatus Poribacteria bacterium]|nr:MAG: restriction endonuclease subunit M [Candidatus Poribacteria bacterium]